MLVQFSLKNFKLFKDKATLSLIASNYDKETREDENIFEDENFRFRLLKSAVVYGANASGKSKLIEAYEFVRYFIINSSNSLQNGDKIDVAPFRLSNETDTKPSEFEVIFIHQNILYRYGFEVTEKQVISEWLYYKPKTKEIEVFYRDMNKFEIHPRLFNKGKTVEKEGLVRDNALMISVAAQFNESIAMNVINWFKKMKILSGLHEYGYKGFTMSKTEVPFQKEKILTLLKIADLGINDIRLEKFDINNLPSKYPKELKEKLLNESNDENAVLVSDILTMHKIYNSDKKVIDNISFSLEDDESSGTNKFFYLTGPILDVLENGYTLVVDELDSKLHPNLVCEIVSIFNSKELNPKNAQLIFNTHDTNLLGSGLFRRDQIWFTDKNKYGEAKLYSLADFKSDEVKKSEPFEDNYIRGKYGAVPYLGLFKNISELIPESENE